MKARNKHIIFCNNADQRRLSKKYTSPHTLILNYDSNEDDDIKICLPHFIKNLSCHIPDKLKDLLDIAGYIYAADRLIKRGQNNDVVYHGWARELLFVIKVRDFDFWNNSSIKRKLRDALIFMTGDFDYDFEFQKKDDEVQKYLYDDPLIKIDNDRNIKVVLFSGGLDSLSGIVDLLETTDSNILLVSHRSQNPGIIKTQNAIYKRLTEDYPNRLMYYPFVCNLGKRRAKEETQRSRIFLYTTIAFALAQTYSENEIYVYENGVTSINFSKRQDLISARASRTTHPKALTMLENFFSVLSEKRMKIHHPFLYLTKSEVIDKLKIHKKHNYIDSTVTCTRTFNRFENNSHATHCGGCSQCIDRHFAMYAIEMEDHDAQYDFDFVKDSLVNQEHKKFLYDYLNLTYNFSKLNIDSFYYEYQDVLVDILDYIEGDDELTKVTKLFDLCQRHVQYVSHAVKRIQNMDDPFRPTLPDSLYTYLSKKEYFVDPVELLCKKISERLHISIPVAFESEKPKDERQLNDFINSVLIDNKSEYYREFPVVNFALAKTIPDHSIDKYNLFIESKYLRGKTTKSVITDGIAKDLIKYPQDKHVLYVVYDPERKIVDDNEFRNEFKRKGNYLIDVIR